MTEKEDFIRVVTNLFSVIKVEGTEERLNEFDKQTKNAINTLDYRIMSGQVHRDERDLFINEVLRIRNQYLNN